MRRAIHFTVSIFLLGAIPSSLWADSWCATTWPNSVFCDDFDEYDYVSFGDAWVITGPCGSPMALDNDFYSSPPQTGKTNTQQHGDFGYSINTISDACRDAFGQSYSSVTGTNLNPLVLELVMNGQSGGSGKGQYDNSFFTLGSGTAAAPTDWAWSDWCSCLPPPLHRWPVICQQESPTAACPPINQASPIPVLAAGFLAYLDSNPCHCGESFQSPFNEHLSFFDGFKWYKLRSGLFTGSGNFILRSNENKIKITIKPAFIKVELTTPDTGEYSWCEIPGGYSGPFNSLATGFHVACQLKSATWACRDDPSCNDTVGVPGGGVPRYDNIVLHGGIGFAPPGACCYADTHCDEAVPPGDCQTLGGQFAGSGTTCANTACCPPQPGDHDLDTDVDMADFGWFQRCLSGTNIPVTNVPCRCADLNNDGAADGADVLIFAKCMLGPDVPASPTCVN